MREFALLITPAEAVKISEQSNNFVPMGHSAMEIAEYCTRCMIQAVFDAGRIQGIREERNRRRGQK